MAYDHTDALRSPLLEDAQAAHRARVKEAYRAVIATHGPLLERLARPAESTLFHTNPHTRIGY